jgi:hypothetical protein
MTIPLITSDGSVVLYFKCAHIIGLRHFSEEWIQKVYLNMMERSLRLQHEGRRRRGQGPGDEMPPVYEVYDLEGIGLEHFRAMVAAKKLTRVLAIGQKHYPENLRAAFMLSAPTGFESAWNVISKVLHERTRAKVHITAGDGRSLLSQVLGTSALEVSRLFGSIKEYRRRPTEGPTLIGSDLADAWDQCAK